MGAQVEIVSGVIRAGPEFQTYGDPYDFSASFYIQNNEAYILAAAGNFSKKIFKEIYEEFLRFGITDVHWKRLHKNKQIHVKIKENLK